MTDLMEQRAEEIFAQIDRFGEGRMLEGVLAGIERGWFQQQMADAAFRYQQQLEKGEKVIVGVNKYVTEDETPLEILRISAEVEREQRAELARRRAARDQDAVENALRRPRFRSERLCGPRRRRCRRTRARHRRPATGRSRPGT